MPKKHKFVKERKGESASDFLKRCSLSEDSMPEIKMSFTEKQVRELRKELISMKLTIGQMFKIIDDELSYFSPKVLSHLDPETRGEYEYAKACLLKIESKLIVKAIDLRFHEQTE